MLRRRFLLSATSTGLVAPWVARAATQNLTITVTPPAPPPSARGPQPFTQQPGFTPISTISSITSPGKYRLTGNDNASSLSVANVIIDAAGFTLTAQNFSLVGSNITLMNAKTGNLTVYLAGTGSVITNCTINQSAIYNPVTIYANNVTVSNCAINGSSGSVNTGTDDLIFLLSSSDSVPNTGFQALNNIFTLSGDCGIEAMGYISGCLVQNNEFHKVQIAVGGWYDLERGSGFHFDHCAFQGNFAEAATVPVLFDFGAYANDDATAMATWGPNGNFWNPASHNNQFSGNVYA